MLAYIYCFKLVVIKFVHILKDLHFFYSSPPKFCISDVIFYIFMFIP